LSSWLGEEGTGVAEGEVSLLSRQAAMDESSKQPRWYNRPLPVWFPGWFVACVLCGASFAVALWYGVPAKADDPAWKVPALVFGGGFALMLVILSLSQNQPLPSGRHSGLRPPPWVQQPVLTALAVGQGAAWVGQGGAAVAAGVLL